MQPAKAVGEFPGIMILFREYLHISWDLWLRYTNTLKRELTWLVVYVHKKKMPQQNVFVISNKTEFIELNPTCICTLGQYIRYIGSLH
jgi:hypothetical protein